MLTVEDSKTFDWKNIPLAMCLEGNAKDAFYTLRCYEHLLKRVEEVGLVKLYEKLIAPLSVAFRDMEYDGLIIDQKVLAELKVAISDKIKRLEGELKTSNRVPADSNLNSADDLIKILFSLEWENDDWQIKEDVGFGLYPPVKTKKGQPGTDDETMTLVKSMVDEEVVKRGLNVKKK